ncbi:MAG: hypothetical protein K2N02_00390, partial [Alistipes sp.]|nr:hypothetical protein [Alistipes sp.]
VFICGGWGRRIYDAGRRRWQRKALQANLRPASSVEKTIYPSVIARHRRCRGDLNKNNNRAVMIQAKMGCFI